MSHFSNTLCKVLGLQFGYIAFSSTELALLATTMTNGTTPTPEQNARNIALLTQAVDTLVSQFIRPNAQQANANRETLDEVVELLNRHAEAIVAVDERLERMADLTTQFDSRLEDTRALVAENGSQVAQLNVKIDDFVEEGRAMRESMQTQLSAIIGNARRIDRLEQAS